MSKPTDSKDTATATKPADGWQAYVEDFRRAGHETVDRIARYLGSVAEMPVLARMAEKNPGPLDQQSVTAIFRSIIGETRRLGTQRMEEQKTSL